MGTYTHTVSEKNNTRLVYNDTKLLTYVLANNFEVLKVYLSASRNKIIFDILSKEHYQNTHYIEVTNPEYHELIWI